jgi:internalin A
MVVPEQSSVTQVVARIVALASGRLEFGLRPGVDPAVLARTESEVGFALPDDVRQFYLAYDGQEPLAPGLLFGYPILPLAEAVDLWRVSLHLADGDATTGDDPAVRQLELNIRWFPISSFGGADVLLVDTDPAETGTVGQVIRGGFEVVGRRALASSLTALLRQVVDAFNAGEVQVNGPMGYTPWGLSPGGMAPWTTPHYYDEAARQEARPAWIAQLDPVWRAWFDSKSDGFGRQFEQSTRVSEIPAGASTLEPLAHVRALGFLHLDDFPLSSLNDIPASESLHALWLGAADSLAGIDRFPALTSLFIQNSPGIDLAPLTVVPHLTTMHIGAPAVHHRALAASRVSGIQTTVRSYRDLDDVLQLDTLAALSLDAEGVDVSESERWSQLRRLTQFTLIGAAVKDLQFLARLPQLRWIELRKMNGFSFRGIANLALRKVVVAEVSDVYDADELNSLPVGTRVGLPFDLWRAVARDTSPFVWDHFSEFPRTEADKQLLQKLRTTPPRRTS